MAILVSKITLGIDVSKDELVIADWDTEQLTRLANQRRQIRSWLKALYGPVRLAIEPTSHYHLAIVEEAQALGFEVYLINPRQLRHYREAVNVRNKTDPEDAWLLARYLAHEASQLRLYQPQSRQAQRLWTLLKRRAVIVASRKQLHLSLQRLPISSQALFRQFDLLLKRIDQYLKRLIRELGWWPDYQRCLSVPGIGPINAAALLCAFHRGSFASSDAFVAFIGLDIRRRESGQYKGKRKLTKRGPAELRRLLYCAAQPARSYYPFEQYLQKQLDKGLSKIAAKVTLARKLARIVFTLLNNQQSFRKQERVPIHSP